MKLSMTEIASILLCLLGVISSGGLMLARRTFYTVFWLAGIATSVAGFMALLGYTYLAIFHLVIYVGAVISFIAFTLLTIGGLEEEPAYQIKVPHLLFSIVVAFVLWYPLYGLSANISPQMKPINWSYVAYIFSEKFWLPSLLVVIALAAVLIEVIALARER